MASSSRGLRPDTTANTKVPEREVRRESQNSSILAPRFQRGAGTPHHAGGTCSHGGMIDYTRFPISELHLGKFPDSLGFQSWKVNFKTEESANSAFSLIRIKEVEIAKSIDELVTPRQIAERRDFPDYEMLDAKIASAWKKHFDKHVHFRRRVSVEEQGA